MNKKHALDENLIRLLAMFFYALVLNISISVIMIIGFVQILMRFIRDDEIVRLTQFSATLNEYNYQIGQFLTLNDEQKPFPFADWPESVELEESEISPEKTVVEPASKETKLSPEDQALKNKVDSQSHLHEQEESDLSKNASIIDQNLTDDEQLDTMKEADA